MSNPLDRLDLDTPFTGETLAKPNENYEPPTSAEYFDLDGLDLDELLTLRDRVNAKLPLQELRDLDLERELVLQYQAVKMLQVKFNEEADVAPNHYAQIANTIASSLGHLTKMQANLYTHERFKQIEHALIRMLKDWEEPGQVEKFLEEYEEITRDL